MNMKKGKKSQSEIINAQIDGQQKVVKNACTNHSAAKKIKKN